MKRIIYVSGTRADFCLMIRPLLELDKFTDLTIIATGMHLLKKWGYTVKEIEKYRFNIKKVKIRYKNSLSSMSKNLGINISKFSKVIERINPDLILVEGDRGEALAGAIVGAHLNIPVIHHGGGDISDSIDNKIRNAISMFSDYHLAGNYESYNRLYNIGIPKSKLFNVGEPGLDDIIEGNFTQKDIILKKFNVHSDKLNLLLIFHPNTKEYNYIEKQVIEILEAIKQLEINTIGIYSNADAGGDIINKYLDEYQSKLPFLKIYKHFFREDFLGLMNVCSAMIGNSSAGITELPLFKKPFICIGSRQKGRLRLDNVIEVDYIKEDIIKAVEKGLFDKNFREKLENMENPYGTGKSYLEFAKAISHIIKDLK